MGKSRVLEKDHISMRQPANLVSDQGKYTEAELMLKGVLTRFQSSFSDGNQESRSFATLFVSILRPLQKFYEAVPVYEKISAAGGRLLVVYHADTLAYCDRHALLLNLLARLAEAEIIFAGSIF